MFVLLAIFLLNIVAAQMLLPSKELASQGSNILFYFGNQVGGKWVGYLMIVAVLSSNGWHHADHTPACIAHQPVNGPTTGSFRRSLPGSAARA